MKRIVAALLAAATLAACVKRYDVAEPLHGMATPPAQADSVVTAPIQIDLSDLPGVITRTVPSPLVAATEKMTIPVHLAPGGPATKLLHLPAQLVMKVLEKAPATVKAAGQPLANEALEQLRPRTFDVDYGVSLASVDLDLQDTLLSVSATLEAFVNARVDAAIATVGVASCGVGEEKPRIRITVTGRLGLSPDAKVTFERTGKKLEWLRPCRPTALEVNVEDVLKLPIVRELVEGKMEAALARLPASYSLLPQLQAAWRQVTQPIRVADGIFAVVEPIAIAVAPPTGTGRILRTRASITARPRVVYGEAVPASTVPFPSLSLSPPAENGFHIQVDGEVSLKQAERLLSAALTGSHLIGGVPVQVAGVSLFGGSNGRLIVAVQVVRPVEVNLYLEGTPRFDTASESIRVDDLEYTESTHNVLVNVADYLLHPTLRELVRAHAHFPVGPLRKRAEAAIAHVEKKGPEYDVNVTTQAVRVLGVFVDRETARAALSAEGTAEMRLKL